MTRYEVVCHVFDTLPPMESWRVTSLDDNGNEHLTVFHGPLAEKRAEAYAERMNEIHSRHISFPHE